ncbi:MAG: polysaccharide biosynthesis protein [Clostridia bacterium]|nr:polysaccharide biosynthesis protein [Clostridia bacterium]
MKKSRLFNVVRIMSVALADMLIMVMSLNVSGWISSNFSRPFFSDNEYVWKFGLLFAVAGVVIFAAASVYKILLRYIGYREIAIIFLAVSFTNLVPLICTRITKFSRLAEISDNTLLINYAIQFAGTVLLRVLIRTFINFRQFRQNHANIVNGKRTMIVGAGEAGRIIVNEMFNGKAKLGKPCCIIDDDPTLAGRSIHGVSVVGTIADIPKAAEKYKIEQIIFAIPSANVNQKKNILEICNKTGCTLKTMPSIYQMISGKNISGQIRNVEVEDLLGRESVKIDMQAVSEWIFGKVVMVTGGGGSIGSELCRQIARYNPKKLIIVDVYENNAYAIEQELLRTCPELDFDTVIASVRETDRLDKLFDFYRPNIVIHAAAHKHVPLMEFSPNEAIKNNVFGTYKTALAAIKYGVDKFVLISTDKAVNPTNIMGASKRLCEMVIQGLSGRSNTHFAAVRFGNVLGSNGSVIPLFKKQIAEGGPVTVTHPDIIRYFMTIPEAVSLVLEAGADAKDGEIYVLDMGAPVKIDDLARNLIRLSGFTPDVDMKIEYTGLRPGEKLYEEMLMSEEGLRRTDNKLIYIGNPIDMDKDFFFEQLKSLQKSCYANAKDIKKIVARIVKTYKYIPENEEE